MQQCGPVVLRLRNDVQLRSTLTLGDSLDLAITSQFPDPCFFPAPLVAPAAGVIPLQPGGGGIDPLDTNQIHEASPHPYAEVQIFGGLRNTDVREVVCTMGYEPPSSTLDHLGRSQIPVVETSEMTP
jgi:hypothetical protein